MSALADSFAGTARLRPAPRRGEPGARPGPAASGPAAYPGWARLSAFVPLALFGALTWGGLVDPAARAAAWTATLAPAAGGGLLLLAATRRRAERALAAAAVVVALAALALLASGVPARLLLPSHWGALTAGIGEGIGSMAGVTVPYDGLDPWVRTSILLCGWAIAALAALLAFWPRQGRRAGWPLAAAVALGALYAVPVIERGTSKPYLGGAIFCVLLGAFLFLERLRRDQLVVGAVSLAAVAGAGALAAPQLDAAHPWIDYQHIAEDVAGTGTETFAWNHTYRAFDWPRDGRVVLRIKAQVPQYWKAVDLDRFDGTAWRQDVQGDAALHYDTEMAAGHLEWHETIRVIVGALRSQAFIGAGTTERIVQAPPATRSSPSTFVTEGPPLQRGASYLARVYVPRPTLTDLGSDGTNYPPYLTPFLQMQLPQSVPGVAPVSVQFPAFHSAAPAELVLATGYSYASPAALDQVRRSPYGRMYALAQRLARTSLSPYQFLERVRRRVQQGAVYSESPGRHRWPLDAFLFSDRRGYCQQFSGAMALLLRMGGVPARVASGFAPGTYDRSSGDWIVRDIDAHSWVEAYFPSLGWVTFDPTPAVAPPRRASSAGASAGAFQDARRLGAKHGAAGLPLPAKGGGGAPWGLIVFAALLVCALAAGALLLHRRGRPPGPPPDPELLELKTALHRTGRTPPPEVTLARLERILGGSHGAAAYVRAVREQRFRGGPGPTAAQRRALRRQLGDGLGLGGRLRAWWAIPPQLSPARRLLPGRPVGASPRTFT